MRRATATLVACLTVGAIAGCGGDDGSEEGAATTATTAKPEQPPKPHKQTPKPTGAPVEVRSSDYGEILTDADGRTLYLFDKETSERSECFGACEDAWPVLFTKGEPRAGKGVDQRLLGTTDHDGKEQVTYKGHPLYYYVSEGPNEVLCQGVDEFGGLWLVVDPATGDAIPA